MIEVNNLVKQFDNLIAVDHLSFRVDAGEVLGFLGPNGAGKSTTMKMITGFLTPTEGSVKVCGHDVISDAMAAREKIGYLPEGSPCYGDMTVYDFLSYIADIRGLKQLKSERLEAVVKDLALEKVLHQSIETLSKGFNRRVGLAQALLHDPQILVLDEPTDGLDPNQKHHVRELIKNLAKDKIVIISTHILEEVTAVCSRAIIIAGGKLVVDEKPEQLQRRSRYHNAVTIHLTEAVADIEAQLLAQDDVEAVEMEADKLLMTAFPKDGQSLFLTIDQLSREQHWPVAELYVEKGRLDDVFRSVTEEMSA